MRETTNVYCNLTFTSDTDKFNIADFESHIQISKKRSWIKGDLQHPDFEESARLDSRVVLESNISKDYDGSEVITEFFNYLISKKSDILILKKKYNASLYFDVVINLEDEFSPVVFLQHKHLSYLTDIGSSLNYSVYDYK